jgi:hypothetical protein
MPGLVPDSWGPAAWTFLHSITFNYPENPTKEHKELHKSYFESLTYLLPCDECRESYSKFIKEKGDTELNDDALKNKGSLTLWLYNLHNRVNNKLGKTDNISYEDVVKKYEGFRAVCVSHHCMSPTMSREKENIKKKYRLVKDESIDITKVNQ